MSITITHSRGDTFDYVLSLPSTIADGEFVGWTATSQIRTRGGGLVADLTVTWPDDPVRRTVRLFAADTSAWPVASDHRCDVQFVRTSDGYVRSTETFIVNVTQDVTTP